MAAGVSPAVEPWRPARRNRGWSFPYARKNRSPIRAAGRLTQTLHQCFTQAEPRASIALLIFWKNLFELNPVLRPLLPENAAEQDQVLTRLLNAEVGALAGTSSSAPRPVQAGMTDGTAPCSVAGEALLWTLQEAYGADFTPRAHSAWEALYRFVTGTTKTAPAKVSARGAAAALAAA